VEALQGAELTGTNRPCGLIAINFHIVVVGTLGGFRTLRDEFRLAEPGCAHAIGSGSNACADHRLRWSRSKLGERATTWIDSRWRGWALPNRADPREARNPLGASSEVETARFRSSRHPKISGGHTGGATPDPISNSEVKSSRAHGTAGGTLWESRSLPG
jgi:hypothetical protein